MVGVVEAWGLFSDGEMSLDEYGEQLLEEGYDPREVRRMLSDDIGYPIPKNYFGMEDDAPTEAEIERQQSNIAALFASAGISLED